MIPHTVAKAIARFARVWFPIIEENAKVPGRNLEDLRGKGKGRVAVLISAGTSIEGRAKKLSLLNYDSNVDVFMVDRAYKYLSSRGVRADYVISSDYRKTIADCVDIPLQGVSASLIASIYTNPSLGKAWPRPPYWYMTVDKAEIIDKHAVKLWHACGGGTVCGVPSGGGSATSLIPITIALMGYDTIYLVGFDLCWYGHKERPGIRPKRRYIRKKRLYKIKDVYGRWCNSRISYMNHADWLERNISVAIKEYGCQVFDVNDGGLLGNDIPKVRERDFYALQQLSHENRGDKKKVL